MTPIVRLQNLRNPIESNLPPKSRPHMRNQIEVPVIPKGISRHMPNRLLHKPRRQRLLPIQQLIRPPRILHPRPHIIPRSKPQRRLQQIAILLRIILQRPRPPPQSRTSPIPIPQRPVIHHRSRSPSLVLRRKQRLRTSNPRIRILSTPILPRLHRQPRRPRVNRPRTDGPPRLIRLPPMKPAPLHPHHPIRNPDRHHIVRNMRRVLLVVPQRSHRILRRRSPCGNAVGPIAGSPTGPP